VPDLVEPSSPYTPSKSEDEKYEVSSYVSNTSGPHFRVTREEYAQFDGACDEKPADESKVSERKSTSSEDKVSPRKSSSSEHRPSLHRKISNLGKGAIEKVKELTTHVAEDLKLRAISPYRASGSRTEELSPSKQRKTTEAKNIDQGASQGSLNSLRVHAASSALDLTEENMKALAENGKRTPSHASEKSFGSLVVNLPGDRPPKPKTPLSSNPFAQYAGRQSLDAMQDREADCSEATQEHIYGIQRATPAASDAADLQNHALPKAKKLIGAGLSDITNMPKPTKIKPKKQGDESSKQGEILED
jgi:hypothetical protein